MINSTYNNEVALAKLKFVTLDSSELHTICSKIHQNALAAGAQALLGELKTLLQTILPKAGALPQTPLGELTTLPRPPCRRSTKVHNITEKFHLKNPPGSFTKSINRH